jgi:DNA mismatch repair protein MutL
MAAVPSQRIHRLPEAVINQIAAGEVIERPVSVVKELLENSIDAGAGRITVEVRGGGGRLIRVTDDGCGIHPEDLQLAIDRHTTSKLSRAEDLVRIGTLGFRGEALSSIAAVSRLTLTSRQAGAPHGWKVDPADTGELTVIRPAPHAVGTTVEVRDLFYNTPARRKFLRSDKTEFIHIQDLVKHISLSRTEMSLRLVHNNREVLNLSATELKPDGRMQTVLGRQFAGHCVPVQHRSGDYFLHGWMGLPGFARSQSDQQYFYLNGRSIRDKLISHAVRLACQEQLHPGRQPAYLLYLDLDAELVDVNVHPAKLEVRFRDPRDVHDFVYGCLVNVLGGRGEGVKHDAVAEVTTMPDYPAGRERAWQVNETPMASSSRNYQSVYPAQKNTTGAGPLLLVLERYIIADDGAGLIVVDSLRARELITQVRLRTTHAEGSVRSRPVLVPLVLPVSGDEEKLLDQHHIQLAQLGLVIRHSAPSHMMVRELPLALVQVDAMALLKDVIDLLKDRAKNETLVPDLIALFARHANDCAPATLTINEMQALLSELNGIRAQVDAESFQSAYRELNGRDLQNLFVTKP